MQAVRLSCRAEGSRQKGCPWGGASLCRRDFASELMPAKGTGLPYFGKAPQTHHIRRIQLVLFHRFGFFRTAAALLQGVEAVYIAGITRARLRKIR